MPNCSACPDLAIHIPESSAWWKQVVYVLGGLVFAVCNSLFSGCMAAAMVELFPTRTRYTGVAIGYNAGQTLLGGTAPLVATALIQWTGNDLAPAFYLIACATIAGVSCLFIKARHGQPLDETV